MHRQMLIILTAVVAAWAHGESLNAGLERANEYIGTGDPDSGLTVYRDLLTDNPDSQVVQYGIGFATYEKGLQAMGLQNADAEDDPFLAEALKDFAEAKSSFDAVAASGDKSLRENALFASANSQMHLAKEMDFEQDFDTAAMAYRHAILAFERVLKLNPDHESARRNANHLRYLLKKALQDRPEDRDKKPPENDGQDPPPDLRAYFREAQTQIPGATASIVPDSEQAIVQITVPEGSKP